MVYLWSLHNKFPLTEAELEAVYESCKKRDVDGSFQMSGQKVELVVDLRKSLFNWLKKKTTSLCL